MVEQFGWGPLAPCRYFALEASSSLCRLIAKSDFAQRFLRSWPP